jgi:hypothetical protein
MTTKQLTKQTSSKQAQSTERVGLPLIPENISYICLFAGEYKIVYRGEVEQPTTITMPVYLPETMMHNVNVSRTQKALSHFTRKEKRTVAVEVDKATAVATVKHYQALGIAEKVSDIRYDSHENIVGWTVWFNVGKEK